MFKSKITLSVTIFIFFLIVTSIVKNQTRVLEKQINLISKKISLKEKDLNESEFDFYYLTSPVLISNLARCKLHLIILPFSIVPRFKGARV